MKKENQGSFERSVFTYPFYLFYFIYLSYLVIYATEL